MKRTAKVHYAKRLQNEIDELLAENERLAKAIWNAKAQVLGRAPGVSPFTDFSGAEESMPVRDSAQLRAIILALPFP